jgi:hypothetical protein
MSETQNFGETLFLAILLAATIVTLTSVLTLDPITAKKTQTLKQIPSQAIDFPDNDPNLSQIHTFKALELPTVHY